MKKSTLGFIAVVVVGLGVIVLVQFFSVPIPSYNVPIDGDTIVVAVNIQRTNQGRQSLIEDPALDALAEDMAASSSFTQQDEVKTLQNGGYGTAGGVTANNMLGTAQLIFQLKSNEQANYTDMIMNPAYTRMGISSHFTSDRKSRPLQNDTGRDGVYQPRDMGANTGTCAGVGRCVSAGSGPVDALG